LKKTPKHTYQTEGLSNFLKSDGIRGNEPDKPDKSQFLPNRRSGEKLKGKRGFFAPLAKILDIIGIWSLFKRIVIGNAMKPSNMESRLAQYLHCPLYF
jgi:hypothetical protein